MVMQWEIQEMFVIVYNIHHIWIMTSYLYSHEMCHILNDSIVKYNLQSLAKHVYQISRKEV